MTLGVPSTTSDQFLESRLAYHQRIEPTSGWRSLGIAEIWAYRDLMWILAGRDVRLRYKQTALGVLWVILQPLLTSLLLAVVFGRVAKLPSDGFPYVVFVFCGVIPWNYFSGAVQRASVSVVSDARLITKVYFPRIIIPLASAASTLIDLAVSMVVLVVLLPLYGITPTWRILAVPIPLLVATAAAMGVGLWLAALNVRYRDFIYALPFLLQVWMLASPVVFPLSAAPSRLRTLLSLNPVAPVIEGFRWALLGRSALSTPMVLTSLAMTMALLISGSFYFRRVERSFADIA